MSVEHLGLGLKTLAAKALRLIQTQRRPPEPHFRELAGFDDYERYRDESADERLRRARFEDASAQDTVSFHIRGYCDPCERGVDLLVDYKYAPVTTGRPVPNWRERLECPCGLNNRVRAAIHVFRRYCKPRSSDPIYVTEQVTPLYRWLLERFPGTIGSEYLGESVPFASVREDGIRNESVTRLSFADETFAHIISFDVFEHVPDYKKAFAECCRVLRPGGTLLFTVPFLQDSEKTLVRARVGPYGEVDHLQEPEYHGDPMVSDGCLCFYHFGWDMLDECRPAGFSDVKALSVWSAEFGYLGGEQLLFLARK